MDVHSQVDVEKVFSEVQSHVPSVNITSPLDAAARALGASFPTPWVEALRVPQVFDVPREIVQTMPSFDIRAFQRSMCHRRTAQNALPVCVLCDGTSRLALPHTRLLARDHDDAGASDGGVRPVCESGHLAQEKRVPRGEVVLFLLLTLSSNQSTTWRSSGTLI